MPNNALSDQWLPDARHVSGVAETLRKPPSQIETPIRAAQLTTRVGGQHPVVELGPTRPLLDPSKPTWFCYRKTT